ncbi:MAG: hypothetical protein AB1758_06565 [Candidatus Eremiobacterota bacterium]
MLGGTLTVNAVAGLATFPDLTVSVGGNGYTLAASAPNLTGATSNPFNVIPPTGAFVTFNLPGAGSGPFGICAGPDGRLWVTERGSDEIAAIGTDGTVTEFPVPGAGSAPQGITAGPDGRLWFTQNGGAQIGAITTGGVVSEFAAFGAPPAGIAAGSDGNLWAPDSVALVARYTTAGVATPFFFLFPPFARTNIASGPDNNLWVTNATSVDRLTTAGVLTPFPLGVASTANFICSGPDGALWFSCITPDQVGRMTTAGVPSFFALPAGTTTPAGIAPGPDGNLWMCCATVPGGDAGHGPHHHGRRGHHLPAPGGKQPHRRGDRSGQQPVGDPARDRPGGPHDSVVAPVGRLEDGTRGRAHRTGLSLPESRLDESSATVSVDATVPARSLRAGVVRPSGAAPPAQQVASARLPRRRPVREGLLVGSTWEASFGTPACVAGAAVSAR